MLSNAHQAIRKVQAELRAGRRIAVDIDLAKFFDIVGLLANIQLHPIDQELERRGHRFARYADDLIILVKSKRAAERVMPSITRYLEGTLKLKVNLA